MDERLSSYGLIARASIEYSIPLLTKLFSERFAQLHQVLVLISSLGQVTHLFGQFYHPQLVIDFQNWCFCIILLALIYNGLD